jgi:hypothetical protein
MVEDEWSPSVPGIDHDGPRGVIAALGHARRPG